MKTISVHSIPLPGGPSACMRAEEQPGSNLSLHFARTRDDEDRICVSLSHGSIDQGDFSVEPARAAVAIAWILELDSQAKRKFVKGDVVHRQIHLGNKAALPSLPDATSPEELWDLRQPAAELVRPLFLKPPDFGQLFPYQHDGVEWLLTHSFGVLADDMGLGKTLQAIAAIRRLVAGGQARDALVICPKTLLANWETELARWAPELSRLRVTPQGKTRDEAWQAITGRVHVVITNYEQLRDAPTVLVSRPVDILIADEAHKVRNLEALITQGIRKLQPRRFWALTGTPIERAPEDLVTLLSSLAPARFSIKDVNLPPGALRARVRPYILRRLKKDILNQLPAVLESVETLELLPAQQESYSDALKSHREGSGPGTVLTLTNQLRTICDFDPATGQSIKAERITDILENIRAAGEKAVVFSYLLEPLRLLRQRAAKTIGAHAAVLLEGAMASSDRDETLRRFRDDPDICVLLASLRVAGEGLTLTEANHVLFFNEWWNPSANEQARDRVVRIGQTRGVRVYKFRCRETIEDWLAQILSEKSDLFNLVIDGLAKPSSDVDPRLEPLLRDLEREIEREKHSAPES